MTARLRLDATALALMGYDVAMIPDEALGNETPCEGWTVEDLVRHMNEQHQAVIATVLTDVETGTDDARADFARIAARWVVALEQAGETVTVPKVGRALPAEHVLAVHFVDMLVHRWDLAHALGRQCLVPNSLTDIALPIARSMTGPDSTLSGPGGVYRRSLPEDPDLPPVNNLAALLGRNPQWQPLSPLRKG